MNAANRRPCSAPVGRDAAGARRHTRTARSTNIDCRLFALSPESASDAPSRSMRRAPRSGSARMRRAQPSPSARDNTVISRRAPSLSCGTTSFTTACAPSADTAGATKASDASTYGSPTVIPHSVSSEATRSASPSSHHSAPARRALASTGPGTDSTARSAATREAMWERSSLPGSMWVGAAGIEPTTCSL
jgi:hypothetical protein